MNRVLIFVDDDTFSKSNTGIDPVTYYGSGLGSDIVTVTSIADFDHDKGDSSSITLKYSPYYLRDNQLKLEDGDRALIVGKKAWDILCMLYHNGLRNENGFDASQLDRLGLNCGAFIKVLWKDKDYGMDKVDVQYFMSQEFIKKWDYSKFKYAVTHTYEDSLRYLAFFNSLNEELGYDFETSGMSTEPDFFITGCSVTTENYGIFFSFTDIKRGSTKEQYQDFLRRFSSLSVKHQSDIWAYNLQFEQHVNFREFGTDLELCDAAVYNIIEGFHGKRYSLKWTAQRVMNKRGMPNSGILSWDDAFDELNDKFNKMYWKEVPDPNNPKVSMKVPNCTIDNFEDTSEFKEILKLYPGYDDEFKLLIREHFGNTFANIPSDILGKYCILDSYHTLMIRKILKNEYSDTCVEIYLDNIRLGASLHSGGMYKDLDYHARYQDQCNKMMAYGITYSATVYSKLRLEYFKSITKDVDKYNDSCKTLLGRGEFNKGDVLKISKSIISNNLSELYDSGLDEVTIYEVYGEDVYNAIINGLKETNTRADSGMLRKKKLFVPIVDRLTKALGLDKFRPDENIEKYMFYDVAYKEFLNIWKTQMTDIYHIPDEFTFLGVKYCISDYASKINDDYFRCTSPKEYEIILKFLMDRYKIESSFLSMIYNNLNKVEVKSIFDSMYSGMSIDQAYNHFITNIGTYPQVLKDIVNMYLSDPYGERMTDTFDDARGLRKA